MDLTEKQRLFISEFLVDRNGTQAAIRAGYSKRTANEQSVRLLANISVKKKIEELIAGQEKRTLITADYVLNSLKEVADRCMQKTPVMVKIGKNLVQKVDEKGEGVWEFDSSGACRALELLGKNKRLFIEKIDLNFNDSSQKFAAMSVEEKAQKLIEDGK